MPRQAPTDNLVAGRFHGAPGIPGGHRSPSLQMFEHPLRAPEATSSEHRRFLAFRRCQRLVHGRFWERNPWSGGGGGHPRPPARPPQEGDKKKEPKTTPRTHHPPPPRPSSSS